MIRLLTSVLISGLLVGCSSVSYEKPKVKESTVLPQTIAETKWPWKNAQEETPLKGVTRVWIEKAEDGSSLDLYTFDFKDNPNLSFGMYDQDEDDAAPFDNKADFFDRNAADIARHITDQKRGKVVALWNGLFHGYDRLAKDKPVEGWGTHIGPNVINNRARFNFGSHRWAFGVKNTKLGQRFVVLNQPTMMEMETQMTFGAIGAQCLIRKGKPLKLASSGKTPSINEAGEITGVDDWRTSRTSMAWSNDHRYLHLLLVNEPDNEPMSRRAARLGPEPGDGGWKLGDLQRFWVSFGAENAINSDGGFVTQLVHLRPDASYSFLPPRWTSVNQRVTLGPNFTGGPKGGGTLMSFYIVEKTR